MIHLIAIFHLNATIARDVGPSKSLLGLQQRENHVTPQDGVLWVSYTTHIPTPRLTQRKKWYKQKLDVHLL